MLVLSRKRSEKILISDNIVITVVEIRGDKVRLGIEAPKEIKVDREEVALKRKKMEPDVVSIEECPPHIQELKEYNTI